MSKPKDSVLSRLHKNSISVKDIANQAWCEKQMELNLLHGMKTTQAMAKGQVMHEKMQKEIFVPLTVEPRTYSDRLYKTAYENYMCLSQLYSRKFCREFKIYGSINGYKVAGQIDELRLENGKVSIIEDKTVAAANTTGSRARSDAIQVMLYKKLLDDIKNGEYSYQNFAKAYQLDGMALSEQFVRGLGEMGIVDGLKTLPEMYKKMFEELYKMPATSNILELRYFARELNRLLSSVRIDYNKEEIESVIKDAMAYWNGQREARTVPKSENWKCNMCFFFGKECFVWYKK